MKKSLFVTLEGCEGSGKSTLAKRLKKNLEKLGYDVLLTREPGGTQFAEQIREAIMANDISPETELLLFAAARREHYLSVIKPAMETGTVIICDRFTDSTQAYQGNGDGVDKNKINAINSIALGDHPDKIIDLTLFLDVSPEVGLKRISDNNRETNKMDEKGLDFHKRVCQGYKEMEQLDRVVTIDTQCPWNRILQQGLNAIRLAYDKKNG